ncbi:MAG: hypothetical protein L0216_07000 [Planctomycetales bacterium]|nr:hypothetical protein [Planctomycetales bacterium]
MPGGGAAARRTLRIVNPSWGEDPRTVVISAAPMGGRWVGRLEIQHPDGKLESLAPKKLFGSTAVIVAGATEAEALAKTEEWLRQKYFVV